MNTARMARRRFLQSGAVGLCVAGTATIRTAKADEPQETPERGAQRLSLGKLKAWERLGYGMFIHYGMSTYIGQELPDGKAPATTYAPDRLDVDQWVSVGRDAGMKYAVLTAKHVAGHCLWPSKLTDYTVANSSDRTDIVEQFVTACHKRGVLPGLYYCSWDNHNRFGSKTPSDGNRPGRPYTTSLYQTFQTGQITELLTQYGPIAETWIDIPGVLGRGYRTYLYEHIAQLQPETVMMMNSGVSSGETYHIDYAWPSDLIAIERRLPPGTGHVKWRHIEGHAYYMPGEVCDPIGKDWFYVDGDSPRPTGELSAQLHACRRGGVNLLLDVPPDKHGVIPKASVRALTALRKAAGL